MRRGSSAAARLTHPVILFDGVCNLCNATVDLVVRRDRRGRFRLAPLQSQLARDLLSARRQTDEVSESVVLVDPDGRTSFRSTAALRIAARLGFPWFLLYPLILVPRPLRDLGYDWVARNRYRWFGRRETCRIASPEERSRFLDAAPPAPAGD